MERDPGPDVEVHIQRIAEDEDGQPYIEVQVAGMWPPAKRLYVGEILKLYAHPDKR
jgi:hypothetical protein